MFRKVIPIFGIAAALYSATPVGEWLFDDASDLTKASTGTALVLVGTDSAVTGPESDDGAVSIGVGSHFIMDHGIAANGGGSMVNEYSLAIDFKVPTIQWVSFFQTSSANSNDGDCFVRSGAGTLGLSATGYSSTAIDTDTWYRMVVSVDNGSSYSIYLDGTKILTGTVQSVDGRFGLEETLLMFADENGEDGAIDVAKLQIYDYALTATEVTALGGYNLPNPDETILVGPYLQNVDSAGITVMWESSTATAGTVEYGSDTTYGNSVNTSVTTSKGSTYIHKAKLSGLSVDTEYHFRGIDGVFTTEDRTFRTAPTTGKSSFRFGIWGDSHYTNPAVKMFKYMTDSLNIDFGANHGDLSNSGNNYSDVKTNFVNVDCQYIGEKVPFFSALGNHDVGSSWGGGDEIRRFIDQPMGINSDGSAFRGDYVVMYDNVALIFLDWNNYSTSLVDGGWFEQQLQSDRVQNARFKFVFIHCAPYYERWHSAERSEVKDHLPALVEQYGVDAVYSGHMHGYERGFKNGTYYVTNGGSSYLDSGEPVDTNYAHITQGAYENTPAGFNYGIVNGFVTIDIVDSVAISRLHTFDGNGNFNAVLDSIVMYDENWNGGIDTTDTTDTTVTDTTDSASTTNDLPILAYTLDSTGTEILGRTAEASLAGISFVDNGIQGEAAQFSTTGLTIAQGSADSLGLPTEAITVSCWVNTNSFDTWGGFVGFIQDNGSSEYGWELGSRGSKLSFALKTENGSAMTYLTAPSAATADQWYHLAATYDGSTTRLYVDGVEVTSTTAQSGAIVYADSWLTIGEYKDDNESYKHDGEIDEVIIWDRALDSADIVKLAEKYPVALLDQTVDTVAVNEQVSIRGYSVNARADKFTFTLPESIVTVEGEMVTISFDAEGSVNVGLTAEVNGNSDVLPPVPLLEVISQEVAVETELAAPRFGILGQNNSAIQLALPEKANLKLFSVRGRVLAELTLEKGIQTVELKSLSAGIYIMQINTISGISKNLRVLVK